MQKARAPALLFVILALVAATVSGQSLEIPRAWDDRPDLNGIWQAIGTAHWDIQDHPAGGGPPEMGAIGAIPPGQGVVVGNEIPYQPWALEQKQQNFENRYTEDPEIKCYLPGVPRATYLPYPFQILQGTNKIMMVYGFAEASRGQTREARDYWTRLRDQLPKGSEDHEAVKQALKELQNGQGQERKQ